MHKNLETLCILRKSTIGDAAARMDRSRLGVVLVVDGEGRLLGTITDGDLRRAMLAHMSLSDSVKAILDSKIGSPYAQPITASLSDGPEIFLRLLQDNNILHLPVLDGDQKVVGLVTLEEFLPERLQSFQAVIMAGGRGSRLQPLTEHTPKPMLPIGDRPLLEIIIEQLRQAGVKRVNLTTHRNGEKIADHFGDGQKFGVELRYVEEDRPLGTAGGLGLMEPPNETVLVMNGDILTQVDLKAILAFHRAQGSELSLGVKRYEVEVPFGLVECDGPVVRRISEKPMLNLFVNAGLYLLEPIVYRYLPNGEFCHMTDLIQRLLASGRAVVSFPIHEYWLDIGRPADYEQAQRHVKGSKLYP